MAGRWPRVKDHDSVISMPGIGDQIAAESVIRFIRNR